MCVFDLLGADAAEQERDSNQTLSPDPSKYWFYAKVKTDRSE